MSVRFTEYYELSSPLKSRRLKTAACFADMDLFRGRRGLDAANPYSYEFKTPCISRRIVYPATICGNLRQESIEFYLNFLGQIFDKRRFTYKYRTNKKSVRHVIFDFRCEGMPRHLKLCYLTAFRYIHEYHQVVSSLFEFKDKGFGPAKLFTILQEMHYNKKKLYAFYVGGGHALIETYVDKSAIITLKQFHKNIENPEIKTVHGLFLNHSKIPLDKK